MSFCATPLWAAGGDGTLPVALLTLGFTRSQPQRPGADVLRLIARYLDEPRRARSGTH